MFTQVAVVPLPDSQVSVEELLPITAAIQVQVQRDLGPAWGVEASVYACPSLEQVPPGAWPVIVTNRRRLRVDGFHFVMSGMPFGVVGNDPKKLSMGLSHEIAEMLVDPSGQRTIAGPALQPVGAPSRGAGPGATPDATTVDYFVEVCDVCEDNDYDINGIRVSDFVLPGYYDHDRARFQGYSFTGDVTAPRQVLESGYITWRERFPGDTVFQAFGLANNVGIPESVQSMAGAADLGSVTNPPDWASAVQTGRPRVLAVLTLPTSPTRMWRELIADLARTMQRKAKPASKGQAAARTDEATTASDAFAKAFTGNVNGLLATMKGKQPPAPSIPELLKAIQNPVAGKAFGQKYGITGAPSPDPQKRKKIIAYLKRQQQLSGIFGSEIDPELGSWMWMIMA